jgi:hypothetical protein
VNLLKGTLPQQWQTMTKLQYMCAHPETPTILSCCAVFAVGSAGRACVSSATMLPTL